jgi:hypothetical protein
MGDLLRDRAYSQKLMGDHLHLVSALEKGKEGAGEAFASHVAIASERLLEVIVSEEVPI